MAIIQRMKKSGAYLYFAVLVAGCATLGVEISAAHLLRAVYGTSNLVWASVIGLMLLFLTVGYWVGGRWADQNPSPATFYRILAWGGFAAGAAGLLTRLLLRPAAAALATLQVGPAVGSFLAAIALLGVPVTLLGCVSPYAVRLALGQGEAMDEGGRSSARRASQAGRTTGRVYAASTVGSFIGTFLPPLLLIPLLGARLTYWVLTGVLLIVALVGLVGRRLSLAFSVLTVGMVSLGAEVAANRLLGPTFGDSNLVWAAVIGVNMAALAAGYFAGGRLADWVPDRKAFFGLLVMAALTAALSPLMAGPALDVAGQLVLETPAGFVVGVTAAAVLLFAVPVALMGSVSPFAIRLLLPDTPAAGGTAGALYAISTVGSLLGAFLPVLWLIPAIGAAGALLVLALLLSLVALGWLLRQGRRGDRALILLPVALLAAVPLSQGPLKATPGQIFETESAYNYVEVVEQEGVRYLLLNEGQGVHSVYDPADALTRGTWDFFLAAPFFNAPPHRPADVRSLALVGLAAGTISKQYTAAFGPIPIDGIEIDPDIVEVGREYFAMTEPNLNVIVGDGRFELARRARRYDVIGVDAYRLPYIPWHLTTQEFFREARAHLTDRGVLVINVGRTQTDRSLVEAMTATLMTVFATVHAMDVPGTFNTILAATLQPTAADNLAQNLALLDPGGPRMLGDALTYAQAALRPTVASDTIFTDDHAPVEMLTNRIVIDYVLSGGVDALGSPIGK